MKEIKMPRFDVNDNNVTILEICVTDGTYVKQKDMIMKAESTKMIREIRAEEEGFVRLNVKCFDVKENGDTVAFLFKTKEEYENFVLGSVEEKKEEIEVNVTAKARTLAKELEIDINEIAVVKKDGIIKTADVQEYYRTHSKARYQIDMGISVPTTINVYDRERVLIICAGRLSEQVIDIMLDDRDKCIVGLVDGHKREYSSYPYPLFTCNVYEVPDKIDHSYYDTVIIAFGGDKKSMKFRKELYDYYKQRDICFTNAIGDNVNIRRAVKIGENNIIMHNCFIGTGSQIGDNNIISYGTCIGHHCVVGSHNLFAPGFVMPGSVKVGNENVIMTGVKTINYITIGSNTIIPIGYNVMHDIADGTNLCTIL